MVRTVVLPPQREADFQAQVIELAQLNGWWHFHVYDSRRSPAGFPDLVLVRPPRLIFAELKRSEKEKATLEQVAWLGALSLCPGVETYLWRPGDWDSIMRTLRR